MRDEELREQLKAWIRPVERLPAPDIAVIRRRARRRMMRNAAKAVAAVAVAAVAAGVIVVNLPRGGRLEAAPVPSPHATWYPAGRLPVANAGPAAAPYFVTLAFQQGRRARGSDRRVHRQGALGRAPAGCLACVS